MVRTPGTMSRDLFTLMSATWQFVCTAMVVKEKNRVLDNIYSSAASKARTSALARVRCMFMRQVTLILFSYLQKVMPVELGTMEAFVNLPVT